MLDPRSTPDLARILARRARAPRSGVLLLAQAACGGWPSRPSKTPAPSSREAEETLNTLGVRASRADLGAVHLHHAATRRRLLPKRARRKSRAATRVREGGRTVSRPAAAAGPRAEADAAAAAADDACTGGSRVNGGVDARSRRRSRPTTARVPTAVRARTARRSASTSPPSSGSWPRAAIPRSWRTCGSGGVASPRPCARATRASSS